VNKEKKKYKFADFNELWGEEMGRGRMSWMGKGDWVIIVLIFALLGVSQFLICTEKMPGFCPQPWFKYFFIAAGAIWFIGGIVRFLVPAWRRPLPGLFMPGYAFMTFGIMLVGGLKMWPVIVIARVLFIVETAIYNHSRRKMLEKEHGEDSWEQ